jgi:hypothetical protein
MRKPVGARVQFAVAQALLTTHHRYRFRRALHLRFEQCMDRPVPRVRATCRIEIHPNLLALGFRQDVQTVERRLRRLLQCSRQPLKRGKHIAAHALRANPRDRLHGHAEVFAQVRVRSLSTAA